MSRGGKMINAVIKHCTEERESIPSYQVASGGHSQTSEAYYSHNTQEREMIPKYHVMSGGHSEASQAYSYHSTQERKMIPSYHVMSTGGHSQASEAYSHNTQEREIIPSHHVVPAGHSQAYSSAKYGGYSHEGYDAYPPVVYAPNKNSGYSSQAHHQEYSSGRNSHAVGGLLASGAAAVAAVGAYGLRKLHRRSHNGTFSGTYKVKYQSESHC